MKLTLHGRDSIKIVNPHKEFFNDTKVKIGKTNKTITLTPTQKADQLGNDFYGKSYIGHVLVNGDQVISNTLENRVPKNSFDSSSALSKSNGQSNPPSVLNFAKVGVVKA